MSTVDFSQISALWRCNVTQKRRPFTDLPAALNECNLSINKDDALAETVRAGDGFFVKLENPIRRGAGHNKVDLVVSLKRSDWMEPPSGKTVKLTVRSKESSNKAHCSQQEVRLKPVRKSHDELVFLASTTPGRSELEVRAEPDLVPTKSEGRRARCRRHLAQRLARGWTSPFLR